MNDSVRTTTTISSTKALVLRFQLSAILHLFLLSFTPIAVMSADQLQLSRTDSQALRRGVLQKLGLEHVPVQTGPSIEVPQHMWDIYDDDNDVDWIRHYYPKDIIENNTGFLLSYNLSLAARNAHNEEVEKAILKLRLKRNNKVKKSGKIYISFFVDDMTNNRLQLESRSIGDLNDWIDFDVTPAFSRRGIDCVSFVVELPDDVEIDEAQSSSMSSLPFARVQSAPLIVFSNLSEPSSVRRKRSAQTGNSERKTRKKGRKQQVYEADSNLCRRTDLYVDFADMGWHDWIMAPKGYDAYQCQGSCPNPMPAQLNATNHAIIQSLLHSLKPDQVPPPCCVPTETSPLSILYMDVDKVIVIKEYADMRVDSCGCR